MSKKITPIEGTPDSFLMLDVFDKPNDITEYLELLTIDPDTRQNSKSRPRVSFYAEKDSETKSLAYLRCPSIKQVKKFTKKLRTIAHTVDPSVNIIKIVKYENGTKLINAHADKTIDLDDKTPIYNVRLGTPRKFVLEHKTNGTVITTTIPHNAIFILGLKTNMEFTHAVPEEPNVTDCTYSIILRRSVTFKDSETDFLWGPRTPFPLYSDLKGYLSTGKKANDNKTELIKLWGIENSCEVGPDHYTNYSTTTCTTALMSSRI
ncbi:2OG-FeII oxygenase [Klosneuvirus KNV1]|mgnify:CR=1 FL=1|uniref:2OG-FeII oxygenase n=1 Tax=Klosneuvirus KNV1 TaxID=1977640 RepID=A0A1V0SK01_9VIRU|nr:2OG-FeII oxygenase [Klosneuvirus KNV1]